ncbi:MAG: type II 3-dehydroquinate dehydratase [Muribaculum sp.]|nr:type II 3-dehydroquinate dehydratase [Muribaculum sp.]
MIAVINGPNLNMLGLRNPGVYGSKSFADFLPEAENLVHELSAGKESLEYFQSNCEGELVTKIQQLAFNPDCHGIVFNPGAYAHYSYALRDAIEMAQCPAVIVHISNIHARDEFRHNDVIAPVCQGSICGLGLDGYLLALQFLISKYLISNS